MQSAKAKEQNTNHGQHQARSPPSAAKNLQHVPCRFYRSGQCTAGRNCVFSHDLQQETERAPCKYFQKGNCRFGAKCALAHILPDGRRVNHLPRPVAVPPVFGRIVPENRSFQSSGIHDQLLQSQHPQPERLETAEDIPALKQHLQQLRVNDSAEKMPSFDHNIPDWHETRLYSELSHDRKPEYHTQDKSPAGPANIGLRRSSRTQEDTIRFTAKSPPTRALGPLDAQLPASLDSNGVSWFARHGPVAASVPHTSGFGIPEQFTSHPSSPLPNILVQPSTSLFTPNLGTSPRNSTLGRAMFGRRASAINDRAEEGDLVFEEDFVPSSLNELLTPAERQRRDSRGAEEHISKSPTGSNSGSPSSSRFGLLFSKHKSTESGMRNSPNQNTLLPIGSPLARNPGFASPNPLSPPRMTRNTSALKTDMKPNAKEFNFPKEVKSDDEPFEMDI